MLDSIGIELATLLSSASAFPPSSSCTKYNVELITPPPDKDKMKSQETQVARGYEYYEQTPR